MEEKIPSENGSSSYVSETKREDDQKDNSNPQDTQNSPSTMSRQTPNIDQNNPVNETEENIRRDTVLRRYHKLSQKKDGQEQKRLYDDVSTIIVIVYTVLILVLGFLVYRDISKRLINLENRVSNIESSVTKKGNITIDDIEIYDVK